jgi:type VI secretion system protein ImpB
LRQQLADVRGSLQGNDQLEEILQETLSDQEKLDRIRDELDSGNDDGEDSDG